MPGRQALVPWHYDQRIDLLPNREGEWWPVDCPGISKRLQVLNLDRHIDVVVSGDCTAAIPVHKEWLKLVWFDAHGDFHTLATTESGHIGGMVLSMMRGYGDQTLMRQCNQRPVFAGEVWHVGGSSFDAREDNRMRMSGVIIVDKLEEWSNGKIHLHIDTDVIRYGDIPSAFHPSANGMPLETFYNQMDLLMPYAEILSIKAFDPRLDTDGRGEQLVLELVRRFHEQ